MKASLCIILLVPALGWAQVGGQLDFQALNFTTNPRTAGLAGSAISLADGDISQFYENPTVLDSVAGGNLFFHINPYFADASVISMAYSFDVKSIRNFAIGINYLNFGSFLMTDETGEVLGEFKANDYVITLGKAHQLGPFTLGANLKFVNSSIDIYSTSALAADLGGIFRINKNWSVAMVFENMGFVLTENDVSRSSLPFDVKIGTTFKPEYMPLRFTLTSTNLVESNLSLEEDSSGRSNSAVDDVLRRVNFGTELLLSKNFQLLFGYNHKRKQELRLDTFAGGTGFSYGLMVRIKQITFRYSRATYHAAGGSSFISVQTNLNDFKKIL